MMNTIYDMGIFRANGPYGNFLIWFGALDSRGTIFSSKIQRENPIIQLLPENGKMS